MHGHLNVKLWLRISAEFACQHQTITYLYNEDGIM